MSRHIEFISKEDNIVARAELWENRAPLTCDLVWSNLPIEGHFHHGIYSGAEVAMILPRYLGGEEENATSIVLPGEIGFASIRADEYFEVNADFSEICFFYDRGACPSMNEGPVKVNLFANFVSGQEELFELCHRMRTEGQKPFTIERVSD